MEIPLLQSQKWEKLQSDLGETTFFESNQEFQYLAIKKSTPVGSYLYLPYGPVLAKNSAAKNAFKALMTLAKQENAIFIRIEPQNAKIAAKMPKNAIKSHDLNPADTWILDISGSDEDFKAKLPSRLLRYHRNAEKNGLTIFTSKNPADIKYLVDLQQNLAKTKKISTFSENYLKTELEQDFATLYLVQDGGTKCGENSIFSDVSETAAAAGPRILAAGLVFDDGTTRYNLQGAQSAEGAKMHATGILTIQLILDARAKNLQKFDFWGIAPDGAPKNHPWAGFTSFKKSFGGEAVHYAGTWDIPVNSAKYRLYQIFRALNRVVRKIK